MKKKNYKIACPIFQIKIMPRRIISVLYNTAIYIHKYFLKLPNSRTPYIFTAVILHEIFTVVLRKFYALQNPLDLKP